jgi:hypothetical protein
MCKHWESMTPEEKAREAAPRVSPVKAGQVHCPSSDPKRKGYLITNTPAGWECACKSGHVTAECWHRWALKIRLDELAKAGLFNVVAFICGDDKAFAGHAPERAKSADEVFGPTAAQMDGAILVKPSSRAPVTKWHGVEL